MNPRQYGHTYTGDFDSLPWSTVFHRETDGKEKGVGKDFYFVNLQQDTQFHRRIALDACGSVRSVCTKASSISTAGGNTSNCGQLL